MSGAQQQPQPPHNPNVVPAHDDDQFLGGVLGRIAQQPWRIGGLILVIIITLFIISKLTGTGMHRQNRDAEAAMIAASAGQTGAAWSPPSVMPAAAQVAGPPATTPSTIPKVVNGPTTPFHSNEIPSQHVAFQINNTGSQPSHANGEDQNHDPGGLNGLLKPTTLSGYKATRISHPSTTIEQGRVIECKLINPVTSQIAGFVNAKLTQDVWSVDGTTRLLEADSTMFGEIAHGLINGQDRLFVLWRQITTPPPDLVRITINSPAADELGEAGMPGDLDQHLWRKLKGALILSGVEAFLSGVSSGISGAIQNTTRSNQNGNNSGFGNLNFYQFQGSGDQLASQMLQHDINIPDTLHRDQALHCSAFLSGDLDFSDVYRLERVQ